MARCAVLICLLSFGVLSSATAQGFPEKFVKSMRGELIPGGLVILTLQANTRALYDARTLPQFGNQVVLGFGRDAPLRQSVLFTQKDTASEFEFQLKPRSYIEQRIDGLPPPPKHWQK